MESIELRLSLIIPVYNRPNEMEELLASLTHQTDKGFEVIVVEDGSALKCETIVSKYSNSLDIKYYFKNNSGPGLSRNFGFERSNGNYGIFLDSDCVIPEQYISTVKSALKNDYCDAFGGPDKAHESFTIFQKAINYSMTSFFTTGGIRGGGEKLDKFYPRSFNMGYSRQVFEKTGGFSKMRFGEDIDMSIRIIKKGFRSRLIKDAFVYHKRRSTVKQFFKQTYNSGIARINLFKKYSDSMKLVHFVPTFLIILLVILITCSILYSILFLLPVFIHALLLFTDALFKTKNVAIAILSLITSYLQIFGYGLGFIIASWRRLILNQTEFSAFEKSFYD